MIRINLLVEGRGARSRGSDRGTQILGVGMVALAALGAVVYFTVHRPLLAQIQEIKDTNNDLMSQNQAIQAQTANLAAMQAAVNEAKKQQEGIERLRDSRATPAWLLWELSNIMTRDRQPTITPDMQARLETDVNRQYQQGWDPKKVWITSFKEKGGSFVLTGGAQSDADYVQLALRMQASMFFEDVRMEGGGTTGTKSSPYFKWTLKGKVLY